MNPKTKIVVGCVIALAVIGAGDAIRQRWRIRRAIAEIDRVQANLEQAAKQLPTKRPTKRPTHE